MSRALIGSDVLHRDETVRLQRIAGAHEIDDRIREADERRELHRTIELDQIDMNALRGEVLARGLHVLGRDADARARAYGALSRILGDSDDHAAAPMPRSSG